MSGLWRTVSGMTALFALVSICACNDPEPVAAFRSSISIGDRGISVPLPPPSLTADPTQDVDVEGEVTGEGVLPEGSIVHLSDLESGEEVLVELDPGARGFVASIQLNLSAACLEVWVEAPDGRTGTVSQFGTEITSDDAVRVVSGCE